jgi:uncharacterized DUF497 family protein
MVRLFKKLIGFSWDQGNQDKNYLKHNVGIKECEEAFMDGRKKLFNDPSHSAKEKRYLLFGRTKQQRMLIIAFTIRNSNVRVISARDMKKKERVIYEKAVEAPKI